VSSLVDFEGIELKDSERQSLTPKQERLGGEDNPSYAMNQHDEVSSTTQDDGIHMRRLPRISSTSAATFPVIYEVSSDNTDSMKPEISFGPASSSVSLATNFAQKQRRSTGTGSYERQLSILDPMSDRVSTILVWQNLNVYAGGDRGGFFSRNLSSSQNTEPTGKRLLHNVSGAITGGLWAVMGKCRCSFSWYCQ
jgi:hypothetical protein